MACHACPQSTSVLQKVLLRCYNSISLKSDLFVPFLLSTEVLHNICRLSHACLKPLESREHEVLLLKPHGNKNHRAHVQCSPPNCFPSQGSHCLGSIQCKFWTWWMELIYFSWGITFENFVWIIMVELCGKIWLQRKLNWRIRGRFCLLPTRLFHKDQIWKLHKVDQQRRPIKKLIFSKFRLTKSWIWQTKG